MEDRERKAAALKYRQQIDSAPRLVAKGRGAIADRILEAARQHNIPIEKDPVLVEVLCQLDLDQEIPPELYRAVAEILAYVYRTTRKI
ncbi:MAG: flagellar biosynthesis protein FlhB [Deltaproteobacteria bacterium]|nr:flagellar biosynthesis protein FlhB [Deltaproteobacteria bacterium]